jgi:hypothetical protein
VGTGDTFQWTYREEGSTFVMELHVRYIMMEASRQVCDLA